MDEGPRQPPNSGNCNTVEQTQGEIRSYRDLLVWQDSMELVVEVYRATERFPSAEVYGLRRQIRDAATSVPANIAEGHRRRGSKSYLAFVSNAAGSHAELETHLELARRLEPDRRLERTQSSPVVAIALDAY